VRSRSALQHRRRWGFGAQVAAPHPTPPRPSAAGKDTVKRVREVRAARRLPKFIKSEESGADLLGAADAAGASTRVGTEAGAPHLDQHATPGEGGCRTGREAGPSHKARAHALPLGFVLT
jgi:hypothetical protein